MIKLYNQFESRYIEEMIRSIKREKMVGELNDDEDDDYESRGHGRRMGGGMGMGGMGMRGMGMGGRSMFRGGW